MARNNLGYRGTATKFGSAARQKGPGISFWFDWAPMLVLGLVIAVTAAWSVAGSVTGGYPTPVMMVKPKDPGSNVKPMPSRILAAAHSHRRIE